MHRVVERCRRRADQPRTTTMRKAEVTIPEPSPPSGTGITAVASLKAKGRIGMGAVQARVRPRARKLAERVRPLRITMPAKPQGGGKSRPKPSLRRRLRPRHPRHRASYHTTQWPCGRSGGKTTDAAGPTEQSVAMKYATSSAGRTGSEPMFQCGLCPGRTPNLARRRFGLQHDPKFIQFIGAGPN